MSEHPALTGFALAFAAATWWMIPAGWRIARSPVARQFVFGRRR